MYSTLRAHAANENGSWEIRNRFELTVIIPIIGNSNYLSLFTENLRALIGYNSFKNQNMLVTLAHQNFVPIILDHPSVRSHQPHRPSISKTHDVHPLYM